MAPGLAVIGNLPTRLNGNHSQINSGSAILLCNYMAYDSSLCPISFGLYRPLIQIMNVFQAWLSFPVSKRYDCLHDSLTDHRLISVEITGSDMKYQRGIVSYRNLPPGNLYLGHVFLSLGFVRNRGCVSTVDRF